MHIRTCVVVEEVLGYPESRDEVGGGAVTLLCAPRLSKISRVFGVERRQWQHHVSSFNQRRTGRSDIITQCSAIGNDYDINLATFGLRGIYVEPSTFVGRRSKTSQ